MQCAANPKAKVLDVVAHLIETADRKFKALFAPPPRERTPGAPQRPPPCRAAAPAVCRRRRGARLAARPVSAAVGQPVRVAPGGPRLAPAGSRCSSPLHTGRAQRSVSTSSTRYGPHAASFPQALRRTQRASEAVPLAAAAGPGSHAQGRQAAPRRLALEPLSALAARGSLARWPHRWRRAVTAAGGGPVSAAPSRAAAARPERWTALGGPRLRPGCQPTGGACEARVWGLAARCSLRSLDKVRQAAQQSADRSTQRRCGRRLAVRGSVRRWVAPASCWAARHCFLSPWWGQKRSIGRCAFAPTSAPQGAGNSTGCAALRPCRGTHPSPARRNESVAGGAAHAVKAKPSATLRVARKKHARQP